MTGVMLGLTVLGMVAAFWWRIAFGGLLRKWQAHALAPLLGLPFWLAAWQGWVSWESAGFAVVALHLQFFTPGRDFGNTKSLVEGHGPWAVVMAGAGFWPSVVAPFLVAGGYWAAQKWWPRDRKFWQPTIIAEGVCGLSVYGTGYAGLWLVAGPGP